MRRSALFLVAAVCGAAAVRPALGETAPENRPPAILHDPVAVALRGQPLSVRAVVTDDSGAVKSVTLFYAVSKDMVPARLPMRDSGGGSYLGSVPATLLQGLGVISYYIEAMDEAGAASETPWYAVNIQPPLAAPAPAVAGAASPPEGATNRWSWKKRALVLGGTAAVVGGGAVALSQGGGSSGGSNSSTNLAGTYEGSATRVLELGSEPPVSSTYPIIMVVSLEGTVITDTLHPGQHLEARLSPDGNFSMVGDVNETNLTGRIRYEGTVLGTRVTGSMAGTAISKDGQRGVYTGTFYAIRQ
jgi:hypothetical protein